MTLVPCHRCHSKLDFHPPSSRAHLEFLTTSRGFPSANAASFPHFKAIKNINIQSPPQLATISQLHPALSKRSEHFPLTQIPSHSLLPKHFPPLPSTDPHLKNKPSSPQSLLNRVCPDHCAPNSGRFPRVSKIVLTSPPCTTFPDFHPNLRPVSSPTPSPPSFSTFPTDKMVLSLNYRRPAYVSDSRQSLDSEKGGKSESVTSSGSCPYGIPDALSFDKIISGGTCPVSHSPASSLGLLPPDSNAPNPSAGDDPRVYGLSSLH